LPVYEPTASSARKKELSKRMASEKVSVFKTPEKLKREREEREAQGAVSMCSARIHML
jgi:hypothetical protein